ncbi:MAG: hypothetical protein WA656_19770 [Pseudolabrys sp.]
MRKIMFGILAVALTVMPLSGSFAHEGEYFHHFKHFKHYKVVPKTPPKPSDPPHQTQHTNHTGQWVVGCGIASAASLMVGTAIAASDKNKKNRRQLTLTEAYWAASACPFLLPLALVAQAACADNKATYKIATLAYRYVDTHPAADQSAFTRAYGEACRTGKLSPEFVAFAVANGLYDPVAKRAVISPRG